MVIAGNGTLEAAMRLGWGKIAVIRSKLTGADARAYAIADNRTAELAAWDNDLLALTLTELKGFDFDLDELGFGADELERIAGAGINGESGLTDPDDIPEPPDEAITQRGDLWLLGNHRLLCGDSASAEDVNRLIAIDPTNKREEVTDSGLKPNLLSIHLVNTDPPYNVKVEPRSNNAIAAGNSSFAMMKPEEKTSSSAARDDTGLHHHQSFDVARQGAKQATHKKLRPKDRPLVNDFVSDEEFDRLLRGWFGNIARVLVPGRGFYIWGGYANCANYPPVLKSNGLYFSQAIIWVKEHPVLTRKDFMGNHEWCFYGWKEGAAHVFLGPNNATDVWPVKKVTPQSMIHLTEKPVELAVRAMTFSSRPGENVLDLFGGSGSTLIAAEQTGRKAFLMELDALYCDVIVRRYEAFTGKKGQRLAN
ncbi:MAG: DNA methyltransferase, partial [Planctomycetota bacterium]